MSDLVKCLLFGLLVRVGIILYSEWHDNNFNVPFTDVDYKVFSDAARYVANGESPYKRHTYRYPPILAWLLVPNVVFPIWGKIFFSLVDVFSSILYEKLMKVQQFSDLVSLRCAQAWIFNPISIIISTRGNSDSLIGLSVLLSVFFLLKHKPSLAGLFLALSIHLRLYPIIFSLPMYLAASSKPDSSNTFTQKISNSVKNLFPEKSQISLTLSCIISLFFFTSFCYYLYGMEYLEESILYHLSRKDTRHNFSLYFYLLYLQPNQPSILLFFPQLVLLIVFSLFYGRKSTLIFCLFAQTFVFVSYNPVITSQYFIWYLSLLIPCLPSFNLSLFEAGKLIVIWLFSQLAWLVPAYLLEFRGRNTFLFIWFQGVGFFCANIAVLVKLIKSYNVKIKSEKVVKSE